VVILLSMVGLVPMAPYIASASAEAVETAQMWIKLGMCQYETTVIETCKLTGSLSSSMTGENPTYGPHVDEWWSGCGGHTPTRLDGQTGSGIVIDDECGVLGWSGTNSSLAR
jgi:hypothetical protein